MKRSRIIISSSDVPVDNNDDEPDDDGSASLIAFRERFCEAQRIFNQVDCAEWPDDFAIQIHLCYIGGKFTWSDGGKRLDCVFLVCWGWVSHSEYMKKHIRNACKKNNNNAVDSGITYYSSFSGWMKSPHRGAVPVPKIKFGFKHRDDAEKLTRCLKWIMQYHETLHDTQTDPDLMAMEAPVPSAWKRVRQATGCDAEELFRTVDAMDFFGL
jgi:hypothetical protein